MAETQIATEIQRIQNARNKIRTKTTAWGLTSSTDKIDAVADAVNGIAGPFAPAATVIEGNTYTISPGYYTGGTVTGIAGGGSYTLQPKGGDDGIPPVEDAMQLITPDDGYYGLSSVKIGKIPSQYKDITDVTATSSDVLSGKIFVTSDGDVTGTMPNIDAVTQTLTTGATSYTIPQGYHSGSGKVQIVTEDKGTITPTTSNQVITPSTNKVISKVTVAGDADLVAGNIKKGVNIFGVDGSFTDSSTVSSGQVAATANKIYVGSSAWVDGVEVKGSMTDLPTDGSTGIVSYSVTTSDNKVAFSITGMANSIYAVALPQSTSHVPGGGAPVSVTLVTSEDVKSSSSLTVSGNTVTVPAGYYASNASASISAGALATPTVSSGGLVTAGVSSAGYLTTSATKTLQLSTEAAKTVTPSTSTQTAVAAGKYTTGAITVAGDADLVAANIKKGVNIFGVDGTFTNTSSAADAGSIVSGCEAWANGNKITGSMPEYEFTSDDQHSLVTNQDDSVTLHLGTGQWSNHYKWLLDNNDYYIPTGLYEVGTQGYSDLHGEFNVYPSGYSTPSGSSTKYLTVELEPEYSGYIRGYNDDGENFTLESSILWRDETDVTVLGPDVTLLKGYYDTHITKSVATATHSNPTATINTSTGVVTASHTQSTGYVTGGTTTGTLSLSTQAAKTVTPSTSSQTAVAAGKYTTGAVTVAAIPSKFVDSSTVTATAANVLEDTYAVVKTGTNTWAVAEGTMTDNGTCSGTINALTATSYTLSAGYYSGGSVSLTNDLLTALQAI